MHGGATRAGARGRRLRISLRRLNARRPNLTVLGLTATSVTALLLMTPAAIAIKPTSSPSGNAHGQGSGSFAATTSSTTTDSTTITSTTTSSTTTSSTTTTSTTTSPPSEPIGSSSGESMPVGDIPGWHQLFADDFTTDVPLGQFPAAVSTRWGAYGDGWHDTTGNGTYNCTKVCSVANGIFDMYIHTENGVHYVAAPFPKLPGASAQNGMLHGRYVVRFRADSLHAYKTAWLLWPDSGKKFPDGEIDYPENNLDSTIQAFVHWKGGSVEADKSGFFTTANDSTWHTATTESSADAVRFYLDGVQIGALTDTTKIPATPMHYVLQTETSTYPAGTVPADSTAGQVQIDWVAVYSPA
jgi:hypothetical protein